MKFVLQYPILDREGKEIILLGDTNCDLTKSSDQVLDNNGKHISSFYELFSFKQLIKEPTRVTIDTATVIDHVATTCPRNIMKSEVREVSMSNHHMAYCIRNFNGAIKKVTKRLRLAKGNVLIRNADVSGICWEQMHTETDDINLLCQLLV